MQRETVTYAHAVVIFPFQADDRDRARRSLKHVDFSPPCREQRPRRAANSGDVEVVEVGCGGGGCGGGEVV